MFNLRCARITWNVTCQLVNKIIKYYYFLYGARWKRSRELHLMATVDPSRPVTRRPTCLQRLQVIKAKERLVLHNSPSRHVNPVLEEFLCEFDPASTTIVLRAEASICRSWVRSLEKFQRLRKDFPLPVGRLTKTSLPLKKCPTTSSCLDLISE